MSERITRKYDYVAAGLAAAVIVLGSSETLGESRMPDPEVAAKAIAERHTACDLEIADMAPSKAVGAEGYRYGSERIAFKLSLAMDKKAPPYLDAYLFNSDVKWSDTEIITRSFGAGYDRYVPVNSMNKEVEATSDGLSVAGELHPRSLYAVGSFVDIWKDDSAKARGQAYLNTVYCGRMVLESAGGDNTEWRLDPAADKPFRDFPPVVSSDEDYAIYGHVAFPGGRPEWPTPLIGLPE